MTKHGRIAELAMAGLTARLLKQGSGLSDVAGCGIASLLRTLEKALRRELPERYYLASIDPGQGKSLAVAEFLKAWASTGYEPDEGAIIGVSRRAEIETFIEASNLDRSDFGVLTSSSDWNALGVPIEEHHRARVLFTTHQMILSRTGGRSFAEATWFHFKGKPRALRIWDEALVPAEPLTIGRDALGILLEPLRLERPAYVEAVEELMSDLAHAADGDRLLVPSALAQMLKPRDWRGGQPPSEKQRELVENLGRLAGHSALVVSDGALGNSLVGVERALPTDFPPVAILDASGRVRPTYELWDQHKHNLFRLPSVVTDYTNLDVQVWQRGSGKTALRTADSRNSILAAVADAINGKPDSEWLVIHYLWDERFQADLKARVSGNPERVRFTTWGRHHGTNEFRNIPNVALIGQLTYPRSAYVGLALASGLPEERYAEVGRDFQDGEFAHHILQAVCRSAVRNVVEGKASRASALLVTTPSRRLHELLGRIFPGAAISEWSPYPAGLRGQSKAAAEYLWGRISAGDQRVRKKDVRAAVGIKNSSTFAGNVMRNPAFRAFLNERGIVAVGQVFAVNREPADDEPG